MDADVIVVGAGLAGLVATHELTRRGKKVALLDQENAANLGGQAFWSFGGLFLVDSPEQRRVGIKDSFELAWSDWQGSAAFDRLDDEDHWAARLGACLCGVRRGGQAPVSGRTRHHLPARRRLGRAGCPQCDRARQLGAPVPRPVGHRHRRSQAFRRLRPGGRRPRAVTFHHRHRVDELVLTDGAATGVRGTLLAPDDAARGVTSNRDEIGDFELSAQAVVITTGGIGGNHEIVRRYWPERMGTAPASMITGVPAYVDGRMLDIAADSGVRLVNRDRMWHYTEGVQNWDPIWPKHAIRILPGPSSMWFDALGRRLPQPFLPGYDTLGTLRYLRTTPDIAPYDHSWFILTQKIIKKEFALSGSEQNPDITSGERKAFVRQRLLNKAAPDPVEAFKKHGADFVVADNLEDLVAKMNALTDEPLLDPAGIRRQIEARDLQLANPFSKDAQIQGIRNARKSLSDRLGRTAAPHRILDPDAGPLIGVKLHILTRKTLGGIQTDLSSRAIGLDGHPIPGLDAAGEVAGFGGGGVHGYNALEGTFLGGCIFSGRAAGRALAQEL